MDSELEFVPQQIKHHEYTYCLHWIMLDQGPCVLKDLLEDARYGSHILMTVLNETVNAWKIKYGNCVRLSRQ